jgi:hypothetical protein
MYQCKPNDPDKRRHQSEGNPDLEVFHKSQIRARAPRVFDDDQVGHGAEHGEVARSVAFTLEDAWPLRLARDCQNDAETCLAAHHAVVSLGGAVQWISLDHRANAGTQAECERVL